MLLHKTFKCLIITKCLCDLHAIAFLCMIHRKKMDLLYIYKHIGALRSQDTRERLGHKPSVNTGIRNNFQSSLF